MDGRGTVKIKCPIVSRQHLLCLLDTQVETLSRQWEVPERGSGEMLGHGYYWASASADRQDFKKQAWMMSWGRWAGGGGPGRSSGAPPPLGQGCSAQHCWHFGPGEFLLWGWPGISMLGSILSLPLPTRCHSTSPGVTTENVSRQTSPG